MFKRWKIDEDIQELAAEPTALTVHRYSDGKVLASDPHFDINIRKKYNAPFIDMHRVDLQHCLVRRARELGVQIQLDARVSNIDFEKTEVHTASDKTYSGDLIVAADGLWSKCREQFLGSKDDPLPTGDLAYRIVLNLDEVDDPELKEWISKPTVHFWIGPHAHAVSYSLRAGQMYNIVLLVPDDLPKEVAKQSGSVDEMKKLFEGWDPILNRFLSHVQKVDKWKLMHRPELDTWISDRGNFVMIGDSCHPMLPYLAQGANSSMEDGAVLGGLLSNCRSPSDLKSTLELFQTLRKKRGEAIVRETFAQRESFHMPNGPEQEERDRFFLEQLSQKELKGPFPSRWTCPVVQPWLYGYDAYREVESALEKKD